MSLAEVLTKMSEDELHTAWSFHLSHIRMLKEELQRRWPNHEFEGPCPTPSTQTS